MKKLSDKGQGLVEYLILVCLVAVAAISIVSVVGKNVRQQYGNVSKALQGKSEEKETITDYESSAVESRGFNDFMESAKKSQ